ncbi:PP2C family protein-serine/threonine phosphatase [Roseiconus lacunae]|uniref:PP2C family protein-serine/threonine phosphatase n=1 Tax=Roseiconus lacunae TaxID=2605694 RepID=UPI001E2C5A7C|nr:protein phosphatase 2C domain-containing protein [Roseiconus lacunae]MCD0458330.1 protein phosphatase 2C domain-containing protein [Roseiconus lacunae]
MTKHHTDPKADTTLDLEVPLHQTLEVAGRSDVGQKRAENQDHFLIADLRRQLKIRDTNVAHDGCGNELFGCQEGHLLVVADGMGGHSNGEAASRIAIESSARYVLDMMQWFLKLTSTAEDDFVDELSQCLVSIQQKLWSQPRDGGRTMGTTVTMAYVIPPKMYVVHAGDSRCYLIRDGEVKQLTTDHTVAQQLVQDGGFDQDDPSLQQWRHVLWNCVGAGDKVVRPEAIRVDLQHGDQIVLCSDGLSGVVEEPTILKTVTDAKNCQAAADRLTQLANKKGGPDNITVVAARLCSKAIQS